MQQVIEPFTLNFENHLNRRNTEQSTNVVPPPAIGYLDKEFS
jgi:hypothetical protein